MAVMSGEREDITLMGLAWWSRLNLTASEPMLSRLGRKRWR